MCYIRYLGADAFKLVSQGGLAWLEACQLAGLPWLTHAFSTRCGGLSPAPCKGLNLGFTASDRRDRVEKNRRRFLKHLDGDGWALASVRQVHSSHSFLVTRRDGTQLDYRVPAYAAAPVDSLASPAGDALITTEPGVLLSMRIADCLPVLLVDPRRRAVAAVHAGWRGALARIIEKTVGDMRRALGCDPQELITAVGPSIRACCFEVGAEVVEAYYGRFPDAERFFQKLPNRPEAATDRHSILFLSNYPPGHAPEHVPAARLDLVAVARSQLASAGVKPANVLVAEYCTACRTDLFFSHRREGPATGRQMAAIGIRKAVNSGQ